MVIVLLGILSSTIMPKFFEKSVFTERAFFDDTLNAVRYAQKLAVATGCNVQVAISANSYTLMRQGSSSSSSCPGGSSYNLAIPHPSSGAATYSGDESGMTVVSTASSFVFYPLGNVSTDVSITVNGARKMKVIASTGFVYVCPDLTCAL